VHYLGIVTITARSQAYDDVCDVGNFTSSDYCMSGWGVSTELQCVCAQVITQFELHHRLCRTGFLRLHWMGKLGARSEGPIILFSLVGIPRPSPFQTRFRQGSFG
jgi:hypothetical protein